MLRKRQTRLKTWCATLALSCSLFAGQADAAHWVQVVGSRTSTIFIDTDGIEGIGGIVSAWYLRDFSRPMVSEKGERLYRSSKVLNYYNCTAREIAAARWITYEEKGGKGKVVSDERVSPLEYGDIPPGDVGQPLFDFVCNYAKRHRK